MKVILQVDVRRPFAVSVEILLQFIRTWSCDIIKISPSKPRQTIAIPWKKFKAIWRFNPTKGPIEVPQNTEDFIQAITVLGVRA